MSDNNPQIAAAPATANADAAVESGDRPPAEIVEVNALDEAELLVEEISIDGMCGV